MNAAAHPAQPPQFLPIRVDGLPLEDLAPYPQFVTWKPIWRPGKNGKRGAWTKVPINPRTGALAHSDDPTTWGTAGEVIGRFARAGFMLTERDPFTFLDVDNAIDPATGHLKPWAQAVVDRFPSYWERSPSGCGLKGLIRGKPPRNRIIRIEDGQIEVFFSGKYTTLTGWRLGPVLAPTERAEELAALCAEHCPTPVPIIPLRRAIATSLTDRDVLARATAATNGAKFTALFHRGDTRDYPSGSEADLALVSLLSFWTQDPDQIDRLFRQSALMRIKWDQRADYRQRTIATALAGGQVYTPRHGTTRTGLRTRSARLHLREVAHA